MSLFNTPSIRVFHTENAESIMRKPGATNLSRRPFLDKTVNINKSPDPQLKKQLQTDAKFCPEYKSPRKTPTLDVGIENLFSYKDKTMFEDKLEIIPNTRRLKASDTIPITKRFYGIGIETPPVSPSKTDMPPLTFINFDDSFQLDTFGDLELDTPEISFDEVSVIEMPELDTPEISFDEVSFIEMPELDCSDLEE